MPYSSVDELPKGVQGLPDHAKKIYMAAFNAAWDGTCKDSSDKEACAARVGWGAVKRKYTKNDAGNWVEKSEEVAEFSFVITKASYDKASGEMRWAGVASDTDPDSYEERMTIELFQDFIKRAEIQEQPPSVFCSDAWHGGLPYVSVAHYPDLNGKGIAGDVSNLYIDGKMLKAKGTFRDNPIGRASFKAVCESLYGENKSDLDPVRISISFLDYKHGHGQDGTMVFERKALTDRCPLCKEGIGGKYYLAGHLIHLGMTRVPVNKRTEMIAEVNKSMADEIITQKDDAASIVGEELADELDSEARKALVGKSEILVTKSEEVEQKTESMDEEEECPSCQQNVKPENGKCPQCGAEMKGCAKKKVKKSEVDTETLKSAIREVLAEKVRPEEPVHPLSTAMKVFLSKVDAVVAVDGTSEEKLKAIQDGFNDFGASVRSHVESSARKETPQAVEAKSETSELMTVIKGLQQQVLVLNQRLDSQASVNAAIPVTQQTSVMPQRRSIDPGLVKKSALEEPKMSQIDMIARRSVGIY